MNNRERAQRIADEQGNDAYSVALAMLEEQNKIKAEAVREALDDYTGFFLEISDADNKEYNRGVDDALYQFKLHLESYADKLEKQNDQDATSSR